MSEATEEIRAEIREIAVRIPAHNRDRILCLQDRIEADERKTLDPLNQTYKEAKTC